MDNMEFAQSSSFLSVIPEMSEMFENSDSDSPCSRVTLESTASFSFREIAKLLDKTDSSLLKISADDMDFSEQFIANRINCACECSLL